MANMNLKLKVWRQGGSFGDGRMVPYDAADVSPDMSFLEMLDVVNERLIAAGEPPIVFDSDCREGICGMCSLVINGVPHGPDRGSTVCQLHMRQFKDGDTITVEPWRAAAFPVQRDLVVDRGAFDQLIASGGYVSVNTGSAPDGNAIPVPKDLAEAAMDAAACIGCGACVAACKNASASLFVGAKVSQLALLPQGHPERASRALAMVRTMDELGFGNCSNEGRVRGGLPEGDLHRQHRAPAPGVHAGARDRPGPLTRSRLVRIPGGRSVNFALTPVRQSGRMVGTRRMKAPFGLVAVVWLVASPPGTGAPMAAAPLPPIGASESGERSSRDSPAALLSLSDEELARRVELDVASIGSLSIGAPGSAMLDQSGRPRARSLLGNLVERQGVRDGRDHRGDRRSARQGARALPGRAPHRRRRHQRRGRRPPEAAPVAPGRPRRRSRLLLEVRDAPSSSSRAPPRISTWPKNWALVRSLVTCTDVETILLDTRIQRMLYKYAASIGEDQAWLNDVFFFARGSKSAIVKHVPGHRNHYHVRFYNPVAQELGRRVHPILVELKLVDPPVYTVRHVVRPGQTIGQLAARYGTSIGAIKSSQRPLQFLPARRPLLPHPREGRGAAEHAGRGSVPAASALDARRRWPRPRGRRRRRSTATWRACGSRTRRSSRARSTSSDTHHQ